MNFQLIIEEVLDNIKISSIDKESGTIVVCTLDEFRQRADDFYAEIISIVFKNMREAHKDALEKQQSNIKL
jgi:hypothetical protein